MARQGDAECVIRNVWDARQEEGRQTIGQGLRPDSGGFRSVLLNISEYGDYAGHLPAEVSPGRDVHVQRLFVNDPESDECRVVLDVNERKE